MMAEEVSVLEEAARDLEQGKDFYEIQMTGLGIYFSDSIVSDLESFKISAGVHAVVFGLHRLLSRRFLLQSITAMMVRGCRLSPFWICAGVRPGHTNS